MAIAHVQDAGTTFSAATSSAPAFTSNATVGNQVIVIVAFNSETATISSISGLGAIWRPVADYNNIVNNDALLRMQVWVGSVVTASLKTVTLNFSTSVTGSVNIQEFSGCTQQIDALVFKAGASSTVPNNSEITPHSANTLVISALCTQGAPTLSTTPSGLTMLTAQVAGTTLTLSSGWVIQTTRTGLLNQWTLGTAEEVIYINIAFQATGTTTAAYIRQAWGANTIGAGANTMSTGTLTPLSGSTLIAQALIDFHALNSGTISDGTNTWARQASAANSSDPDVEIWAAFSVAATAVSVTCTWGGASSESSMTVAEWIGIASLDAAGAGTSGTSATPTDGGVTTTNANDVIISIVGLASTASTHETAALSVGYGSSGNVSPQGENQYGAWSIVSSTSTYTCTYTIGSSSVFAGVAAAFKQTVVVTGTLPLPVSTHRPHHHSIPIVRAKRRVRENPIFFSPPPPKFPFPIVHHAQKHRLPMVKAKPRVRNRWIDERQVTAPHADFPEQIRRAAQRRRIPSVKAKRVTRSSIELRIPQAPHADFPPALRHGRNQPKRFPRVRAKPRVRSSIELTIPGPLRLQNPIAAHRGQKHRIPVVKAKRAVRSSLELRIPQAPPLILPLPARHQRGQTKRLPRVRAKPVVRSSIELRIPQAPSPTPPLPIETRRGQRKRLVPAARRQRRSFAIFKVAPASVPSLIFGRRHRVRAPTVHPKRSVRGDIQLLIAPPPAAALPLPVRHARGQSRRLAKVQAKRVTRSSIELRIPPPPPVIFPPALRHGRDQPKRIPRIKAKPAVRNSIELRIPPAVTPILPLPVRRARGQSRRFAKVHAKYVARNSIQLRIPQAPHADFPQGIRRKAQRKPLFKVKAKQRVRSSIELRIPPAPSPIAPISIRGRAKHKLWHYMRAKRVAVSKFMQLSKTLAPFIPPPPPSPDILARWRNRGGPGASRIHGQG